MVQPMKQRLLLGPAECSLPSLPRLCGPVALCSVEGGVFVIAGKRKQGTPVPLWWLPSF